MSKRIVAGAIVVVVTILTMARTPASQTAVSRSPVMLQYAVKVVCAHVATDRGPFLFGGNVDLPMVAGRYMTAINVHNPSDEPVVFSHKLAVAQSAWEAGSISPLGNLSLGPDEVLEFDCLSLFGFLQDESFHEGFAVIESADPLDVVAVRTARPTTGQVSTMDVETVQPREVKHKPLGFIEHR